MANRKPEFIRDKPHKKNGLAFSILHKALPIFLALIWIVICNQKLAYLFEYDFSLLGAPWFLMPNGTPFYYPWLLPILIIKHLTSGDKIIEAIIFEISMQAVIGIFVCVLIYFILSLTRSVLNKYSPVYGTARWGNKNDLKKYGLLLEDGGVVIGETYDAQVDFNITTDGSVKLSLKKPSTLVQHSGKTSSILFAPSRSGKGVSSVIPTFLNWPGSIITFDPKGENFNLTSGFRSLFSTIYRFSPASKDGNTLRFNIMDEINDEKTAYKDANMIAHILVTPADGKIDGSQAHWIETAKELITGVILHVKCSDCKNKNLAGVLSFLSQAGNDEDKGAAFLNKMIKTKHCSPVIDVIVSDIARRALSKPDDERGSVISTAVSKLSIFQDPLVAYATSESDFCLNDFVVSDVPISWYLTVPFSEIDRLSFLVRLIITFVLTRFSSSETQFGEIKLKNHILFIIDEFPTLGAFPILETMMGILAGYGITFYLICQSFTQITKLYGDKNPILDHCRVITTYAMSDLASAEMISKMVGIESVENSNISNSGNRFDFGMNNLNVSEQTIQRNLINPDEVMHLPANEMLVIAQGAPATRCKKCVYYEDERFKDKVNLPGPKNREELLKECINTTKPDKNERQWFDIDPSSYLESVDEPIKVEPALKINLKQLNNSSKDENADKSIEGIVI